MFSNAPATASPEASLYLAKTLVSETSDYADGESDEATLKKRSFVYKELIATEEDYVKDLNTVIDVSGIGVMCMYSGTSLIRTSL